MNPPPPPASSDEEDEAAAEEKQKEKEKDKKKEKRKLKSAAALGAVGGLGPAAGSLEALNAAPRFLKGRTKSRDAHSQLRRARKLHAELSRLPRDLIPTASVVAYPTDPLYTHLYHITATPSARCAQLYRQSIREYAHNTHQKLPAHLQNPPNAMWPAAAAAASDPYSAPHLFSRDPALLHNELAAYHAATAAAATFAALSTSPVGSTFAPMGSARGVGVGGSGAGGMAQGGYAGSNLYLPLPPLPPLMPSSAPPPPAPPLPPLLGFTSASSSTSSSVGGVSSHASDLSTSLPALPPLLSLPALPPLGPPPPPPSASALPPLHPALPPLPLSMDLPPLPPPLPPLSATAPAPSSHLSASLPPLPPAPYLSAPTAPLIPPPLPDTTVVPAINLWCVGTGVPAPTELKSAEPFTSASMGGTPRMGALPSASPRATSLAASSAPTPLFTRATSRPLEGSPQPSPPASSSHSFMSTPMPSPLPLNSPMPVASSTSLSASSGPYPMPSPLSIAGAAPALPPLSQLFPPLTTTGSAAAGGSALARTRSIASSTASLTPFAPTSAAASTAAQTPFFSSTSLSASTATVAAQERALQRCLEDEQNRLSKVMATHASHHQVNACGAASAPSPFFDAAACSLSTDFPSAVALPVATAGGEGAHYFWLSSTSSALAPAFVSGSMSMPAAASEPSPLPLPLPLPPLPPLSLSLPVPQPYSVYGPNEVVLRRSKRAHKPRASDSDSSVDSASDRLARLHTPPTYLTQELAPPRNVSLRRSLRSHHPRSH